MALHRRVSSRVRVRCHASLRERGLGHLKMSLLVSRMFQKILTAMRLSLVSPQHVSGRCHRPDRFCSPGWGEKRFTVVHVQTNTVRAQESTLFPVLTTGAPLLPHPAPGGSVSLGVWNMPFPSLGLDSSAHREAGRGLGTGESHAALSAQTFPGLGYCKPL